MQQPNSCRTCGGEANIETHLHGGIKKYRCGCGDDKCPTAGAWDTTKRGSVEAWNSRASVAR